MESGHWESMAAPAVAKAECAKQTTDHLSPANSLDECGQAAIDAHQLVVDRDLLAVVQHEGASRVISYRQDDALPHVIGVSVW
jgi:hypothetical protein